MGRRGSYHENSTPSFPHFAAAPPDGCRIGPAGPRANQASKLPVLYGRARHHGRERGKITKFRVAGVTDAKSDSKALLPIKVAEPFVTAARKKAEAHHYKPSLKNGKPVEFFTYYFYAPDYPNALISDLYLPPEMQP